MTEKRTETYWYDDKGTLTRKQVHTETSISTEWYPTPQPVYTPPTLPWVSPITITSGQIRADKAQTYALINQPHG